MNMNNKNSHIKRKLIIKSLIINQTNKATLYTTTESAYMVK